MDRGCSRKGCRKETKPPWSSLIEEVWFKICVHGSGEDEDYIIWSIFLWGNAGTDWFFAGVQTLLFTPAFRRPILVLLKGARRHWFLREYHRADVVLQLLRMGVYCYCDNPSEPGLGGGGVIFIKKRRVVEERAGGDNASAPFQPLAPEKWKMGTMRKAWRDCIVSTIYHDKHVHEKYSSCAGSRRGASNG